MLNKGNFYSKIYFFLFFSHCGYEIKMVPNWKNVNLTNKKNFVFELTILELFDSFTTLQPSKDIKIKRAMNIGNYICILSLKKNHQDTCKNDQMWWIQKFHAKIGCLKHSIQL